MRLLYADDLVLERQKIGFFLRPLMLRNEDVGSNGDERLPMPSLTGSPIKLLARLQIS